MGAPFLNQFVTMHARLEDAGIIEHWTETVMADRVRSNREKHRLDPNNEEQVAVQVRL